MYKVFGRAQDASGYQMSNGLGQMRGDLALESLNLPL